MCNSIEKNLENIKDAISQMASSTKLLLDLLEHNDGFKAVKKSLEKHEWHWSRQCDRLRRERDEAKELASKSVNGPREASMLIEQKLKGEYPDIMGYTFLGKIGFIIDKLLEKKGGKEDVK